MKGCGPVRPTQVSLFFRLARCLPFWAKSQRRPPNNSLVRREALSRRMCSQAGLQAVHDIADRDPSDHRGCVG